MVRAISLFENITCAERGCGGEFWSGLRCFVYFRFPLGCIEELPFVPSLPSALDAITPFLSSNSLPSRLDELRLGDANAWA